MHSIQKMVIFILFSALNGNRIFTLEDYTTASSTAGCVYLDLTGDVTLSMSSATCGTSICPGCFVFKSGGYQLTVNDCNYIPTLAATNANYARIVTFANFGTATGDTPSIHDGTSVVATLPKLGTQGSSVQCVCYNGRLSCPS